MLFSALVLLPNIIVLSQTYNELCDRSVAAVNQDSLVQAEQYIRQALALEPANVHNALLFSNLGTIQRRQGHYDDAAKSFAYALNIAPLSVPILLNRASLFLELGKNELARADYSLVLDREKNNREALLMRAYIDVKARNFRSARMDYDSLLKEHPLDYSGRFGLANLEQADGRPPQALDILNKMLVGNPEDAALYIARAGVERDLKHDDLALIDLETALKLNTSQADAYLMRGQIYLDQKKREQAKRDFEKAISLGIPPADLKDLLRQCR